MHSPEHYERIRRSDAAILLGYWTKLRGLCANYRHPATAEIACWAAVETLIDSATSARISPLLSLLTLPDGDIRKATIAVLQQFDFGDDGRLDPLLKLIADCTDESAQLDCLEFLMSSVPIVVTRGLFNADQDTQSALLKILTDDSGETRTELMRQWYCGYNETLRFAVVEALGDAPSRDSGATDLLLDAAIEESRSTDINDAALAALAKHYPDLTPLLHAFTLVLQSDGDSLVCVSAADELWKHICPSVLSPLLLRLFEYHSVALRTAISFALAKLKGTFISHDLKWVSDAASLVFPDVAALNGESEEPLTFGLNLLAKFVGLERDDCTAFHAAALTLRHSHSPTVVRDVVEATVWREDFFRNMHCELPDWAADAILRTPETNDAVVEFFFQYPDAHDFASSIIAYGDIALIEAIQTLEENSELSERSVPFLLRAAADPCGNKASILSTLAFADARCQIEERRIKHAVIPLLLMSPSKNAGKIIRAVADSTWLRQRLCTFAQYKIARGHWNGNPDDIVDGFLSLWWQRLKRTIDPNYAVVKHEDFQAWIKKAFFSVIENDHKRSRTIRKRECASEYHLQTEPQRESSLPDLKKAMQAILARLTTEQQNIFVLRADGLTSSAIAKRLGINKDRVENQIRSARKRLPPTARTFFER